MTKITVKERILKCLFEAPKTTGTISKELGYFKVIDKKSGKETVKYHDVTTQLKQLKDDGFLKSEVDASKPRHGPPPTYYSIVYDIPVLVKMIEKYPRLIPEMQKKEEILNALLDIHKSLMNPFPLSKLITTNELVSEFRKRIQISESFFNICMKNETETLIRMFDLLSAKRLPITTHEKNLGEKIRGKFFLSRDVYPFDLIFDACVDMDILNGVYTGESINFSIMRNKIDLIFCDHNVQVIDNKFQKHRDQLSIKAEKLEECSTDELEKLYYLILSMRYSDKSTKK